MLILKKFCSKSSISKTPIELINKYKELTWELGKDYTSLLKQLEEDKNNTFKHKKIPDYIYTTIINEYLNFDLFEESINILLHV